MRRLDWFTVAIIAVCLALAVVLIVIGVRKFMGNDNNLNNPTTTVYDEIENETTDTYPATAAEEVSNPATPATQEEEPANVTTTDYDNQDLNFDWLDEDEKTTVKNSSNTNSNRSTTRSYSNVGSYMVLAGTFSVVQNAESHASNLRNKGYSNTRVERFDKGAYAVVLVDRFSSESEARKLVRELSSDHGIESYVKTKQ